MSSRTSGRERLRAVVAWLVYPAATGGSVAFALLAADRGAPSWLVAMVTVAVVIVVVEACERVVPYREAWAVPRDDVAADLWHLGLSARALDVGGLLGLLCCAPLRAALEGRVGHALWPAEAPMFAQVALVMLVYELPLYVVHRAAHTLPWAWRFHAVHHSAERLYWRNWARNHPVDNVVGAVLSSGAVALLGAPDRVFAVFAAFSLAHGVLQHANVEQHTGVLDLVLSTARVHRWHHSPRLDEANANYGTTLLVWDWLFGTRRFDPAASPPEALGLDPLTRPLPASWVGQMLAPFERARWAPDGRRDATGE